MSRKTIIFGMLIVVLLLPTVRIVTGQDKAPDFTLTDIDGNQFKRSDYLGKIVLLSFFSTWCKDCITELEQLKNLFHNFTREQLVIISIAIWPHVDTDEELRIFAQKHDVEWTIAGDTDQVFVRYRASLTPHLSLIDSNGSERYAHAGLTDESTLNQELNSLLEGSNDEPDPESSLHTIALIAGGAIILTLGAGILMIRRLRGRPKPSEVRQKKEQTSSALPSHFSLSWLCSYISANAPMAAICRV